jgi:hypothetical protein
LLHHKLTDENAYNTALSLAMQRKATHLVDDLLAGFPQFQTKMAWPLVTSLQENLLFVSKKILSESRFKLGEFSRSESDEVLAAAVGTHDFELIKRIMNDKRIQISEIGRNRALRKAVGVTHGVFDLLFSNYTFSAEALNEAVVAAVEVSDRKLLAFLLSHPQVDPRYKNSAALMKAFKRESLNMIELLLAHPLADHSIVYQLIDAAKHHGGISIALLNAMKEWVADRQELH